MNKDIILLTDYRQRFESKYLDSPYLSGMDKEVLSKLFLEENYNAHFIPLSDYHKILEFPLDIPIITTSNEEVESDYKSFILDITSYLDRKGYNLIPGVDFIQAHNNKIYMDLLFPNKVNGKLKKLDAVLFGTYADYRNYIEHDSPKYPFVLKDAKGSKGKNIYLVKTKESALKKGRRIALKKSFLSRTKDKVRQRIHKGYKLKSSYQKKFLIQEFIEGLNNDWKILIFYDKMFILHRGVKPNGFKASGQGIDYRSAGDAGFPKSFFDEIYSFYKALNTPYVSLDAAIKDDHLYIFEYQCLFFGKSTVTMSDEYYQLQSGKWKLVKNECSQEELLVHSIINFTTINN